MTRSSLSASLTASRTALEALDRSPDDPDTDIDAYTQRFTQGKLRWEARPNLLLQGSARWVSQNEEGVSSQYFAPLNKTYVWRYPDQVQRVDLGAEAEWQWAEGSTANADVFRTYFDKLSREELIGSRQVRDRSTDNVLTKYQLRTTHLLRRTHILTAGLKHTREELEVSLERTLPLGEQQHTVEVPPSRVDVAEAYIQDDWQVAENTGIVWGARYQWHSRYGFHLTPKVSFAQRLSESLKVRASYGAGYRAPSLKELHFVFDHSNLGYKVLGTPSLSPERTWGLNVGAEFRAGGGTRPARQLLPQPTAQPHPNRVRSHAEFRLGGDLRVRQRGTRHNSRNRVRPECPVRRLARGHRRLHLSAGARSRCPARPAGTTAPRPARPCEVDDALGGSPRGQNAPR